MQLISCHDGQLLRLDQANLRANADRTFRSGLEALDDAAPGGAFARGAVHELLSRPSHGKPLFVAMLLARAAVHEPSPGIPAFGSEAQARRGEGRVGVLRERHLAPSPALPRNTGGGGKSMPLKASWTPAAESGAIVWCDPQNELYPPALAAHGIPLRRLYLLQVDPDDQKWAIAECLRCKGVSVVVAPFERLNRIESRRLQLAAEQGGGVGIFLRPTGKNSQVYAAATRWLVAPAPAQRTTQRWTIQLLHGHGGRLSQTITLECCRENHLVRATAELADRSNPKRAAPRLAS